MRIRLNSINDTKKMGNVIADNLSVRDILLLKGEMGAGKTEITKHIVSSLGSEDYVSSPTFAIMNVYRTSDFNIYHFDLYRLENIDDFDTLGMDDYLYDDAISIIEWPDGYDEYLPENRLKIEMIKVDENTRDLYINFEEKYFPHLFSAIQREFKDEYISD